MQLSNSRIPLTECSPSLIPYIYSTIVFTISTLKMEAKDSPETWQLSNRLHDVRGSTKAGCRAADHSSPFQIYSLKNTIL